jgi:hypothetical protein
VRLGIYAIAILSQKYRSNFQEDNYYNFNTFIFTKNFTDRFNPLRLGIDPQSIRSKSLILQPERSIQLGKISIFKLLDWAELAPHKQDERGLAFHEKVELRYHKQAERVP